MQNYEITRVKTKNSFFFLPSATIFGVANGKKAKNSGIIMLSRANIHHSVPCLSHAHPSYLFAPATVLLMMFLTLTGLIGLIFTHSHNKVIISSFTSFTAAQRIDCQTFMV